MITTSKIVKLKPNKQFYKWANAHFTKLVLIRNVEKVQTTDRKKYREIIVKKLRKNTNFYNLSQTIYFSVTLANKSRMEYQTYQAHKSIDKITLQETITYRLYAITVYTDNEVRNYRKDYGDTWYHGALFSFSYYWNVEYHDYPVFNYKKSPLRYIDLSNVNRYDFKHTYLKRELLEQLQKHGMNKLFREVISDYGNHFDYRKLGKKRLIKYRKIIKRHDYSYSDLLLFLYFKEKNIQFNPSAVSYVELRTLDEYENLGLQTSVEKMLRYLVKQQKDLQYYNDYISMVQKVKAELDNYWLYPKDLTEAHDRMAETITKIENKGKDKKLLEEMKNHFYLEYTNETYSIMLPTQSNDLRKEGKALRHCVYNYVDKIAEGKTIVLFVRKNEELTKPYFTVELQKNVIVQVHTDHNEMVADKEYKNMLLEEKEKVLSFLQEWQSKVLGKVQVA